MIKEFKPLPNEYISTIIDEVLNTFKLYPKQIQRRQINSRMILRVDIHCNFLYYKGTLNILLSFKRFCEEIYGLKADESLVVWNHIRGKYNRMLFKKEMVNRGVYRITHSSGYENEFMDKGWESEYQRWVVMKNEGNKKINKPNC